MMPQAGAILWAQWRSLVNNGPRSNRTGAVLALLLGLGWYGLWTVGAVQVARVCASEGSEGLLPVVLPGGLLFVFIYWQVVPILLATSGISLSMKKLQVYPIPHSQLFFLELLLRISTSFEMILLLLGAFVGLLLNPRLPLWAPLGLIPFGIMNLCLSAGTREVMTRVFARKWIREIAVLMLVMAGAIPQLVILLGAGPKVKQWFSATGLAIWPWAAAARVALGHAPLIGLSVLVLWAVAAYAFGRWQFERTLRFDADEAGASHSRQSGEKAGFFDRALGWPSAVFRDPMAVMVEKEIRFLSRAPRFRLVFTMGFTFGLVIWIPMAFGRSGGTGIFANNYLTFVCAYALVLLGDVCFWNAFGFDRSAAQVYWAMPVRFSTVLAAKNVAALFFVLLEIVLVMLACALIRLPMTVVEIGRALMVTLVISVYMMSLGNLTSTWNARAINPARSMRTGAPGRLQALLLLLYPAAAIPVVLAYLAQWAFDSVLAFFAVLIVVGLIGAAIYSVSMETAVAAADRNKERLLSALSEGENLMQG